MGLEKKLMAAGVRLLKPISPNTFHLAWHSRSTSSEAVKGASDLLKNLGQLHIEDTGGYTNVDFDLWLYHRTEGWPKEVMDLVKGEPNYLDAKRRGQYLTRLLPDLKRDEPAQGYHQEQDNIRPLLQMIHFPSLYKCKGISICDFYWHMTVDQPLSSYDSVFLAKIKVISEEFGQE